MSRKVGGKLGVDRGKWRGQLNERTGSREMQLFKTDKQTM
jgi:hypothetical protein